MVSLLTHHGYIAIFILALIESCIFPIPSELTFGYAGVLAAQHHLAIVPAILVGIVAEIIGSTIAFLLGRAGGHPLVERYGRYLLVTTNDLERAERWLDGRGEYAVAIGRALPVLRLFVSWVAGFADMAIGKFLIFSAIGTAVYGAALGAIGYGVGSNWNKVYHDFKLVSYALVVIVVLAIAAVLRHRFVEMRHARGAHARQR